MKLSTKTNKTKQNKIKQRTRQKKTPNKQIIKPRNITTYGCIRCSPSDKIASMFMSTLQRAWASSRHVAFPGCSSFHLYSILLFACTMLWQSSFSASQTEALIPRWTLSNKLFIITCEAIASMSWSVGGCSSFSNGISTIRNN